MDILRPAHPAAKAHPPGVTQPEERRSIFVFKVALVGSDADGAVFAQEIAALIRGDLQNAAPSVQIAAVTRYRPVSVTSRSGGRKSNLPGLLARPERRRGLLVALRVREDHVQLDVIEGIGVGLLGIIGPLRDAAGSPVARGVIKVVVLASSVFLRRAGGIGCQRDRPCCQRCPGLFQKRSTADFIHLIPFP